MDGTTPPDLTQGSSSAFGMYPDFLAEGLDPTMTLFGGSGDYFAEDFLQMEAQAAAQGGVGSGGGTGVGHQPPLVGGEWGMPVGRS